MKSSHPAKRLALTAFVSALLVSCSVHQDEGSEPGKGGKVVATNIDFQDQNCIKQGLPVALDLKNESAAPTVRVRWSFYVNQKDHSTDLAAFDRMTSMNDPNRATDRIIQPGETFRVCSTAPAIQGSFSAENLEYRVSIEETS